VVIHPDYDWAAATLDGFDEVIPGPVEAKHVGGFEPIEKVIERYQPQIQWQMEVTGCVKCILSVIEGGRVPRVVPIDRDRDYADELMARALKLMEHVWNMTEPVVMEPRELKIISRLKDYNMTGNNVWASAANDWLRHKEAAGLWETAVETIRGLVPNDASTATGYGIIAKRDKANRVSIRPVNDISGTVPKQPKSASLIWSPRWRRRRARLETFHAIGLSRCSRALVACRTSSSTPR